MKSPLIKINGEIRPLIEWAEMYDISRWTIWQRAHSGCVGDELIAPVKSDLLDMAFVHEKWGGKWIWRARKKGDTVSKKYFRNKERWVYIGKSYKM